MTALLVGPNMSAILKSVSWSKKNYCYKPYENVSSFDQNIVGFCEISLFLSHIIFLFVGRVRQVQEDLWDQQ